MDQPPTFQTKLGPRTLMQVVDVLRDDQQPARPCGIELRQRPVRGIGFHARQRRAAIIVKAVDQLRIVRQRLGRADILDPVPLPQSAGATKGRDAALGRNPRAGQDDDVVEVAHIDALRRKGRTRQISRTPAIGRGVPVARLAANWL